MADQIDPSAIAKARQAGYSDSEIAEHLAQSNDKIGTARKAGYSDKEILDHLAGGAPSTDSAPAQATTPQPDVDATKVAFDSANSGLNTGFVDTLGFPGDVASLAHSAASPGVISAVKKIPGATWLYNHLPTSAAVRASADPDAGIDYTPPTATGKYIKAIGQNVVPGMITGMGPAGILGAGVGQQAASDLSGGNPLAEAAGNMAGGFLGAAGAARALRATMPKLLDEQGIRDVANAQYADPHIKNTELGGHVPNKVADDMQTALDAGTSAFVPSNAPRTAAAVENLRNANGPVTIEDLHNFRKTLGKLSTEQSAAFRPTEEAVAAGTAKRVLDQYLDSVPAGDIISGDPQAAVASLRAANRNWQAQSSAGRLTNAIGNAEDAAASQHSGMNLGNKLRQAFAPLLKNDAAKIQSMGLGGDTQDTIDAIRRVTRGTVASKTLRYISNSLGGGGGIGGQLVGHAISKGIMPALGYETDGVPGLIVGSTVGTMPGAVARILANRSTMKAANAARDALLARAPANQAIAATQRAIRANQRTQRAKNLLRASAMALQQRMTNKDDGAP